MKLNFNKPFHIDPPKFTYHDEQRRAPVPKKDEKPIQGLVSDKNYIVANAVENILAGNDLFSFFFSSQTSWK